MRKLGLLAAVLLISGCGNGGGSTTSARNTGLDKSAARFVVAVQAQLRRGQFARAWRSLHPAEKRVVSAQRLAACYPRNAYPRTVTFRAHEVRDVTWNVPGTTGLSDAEAVAVTATAGGRTIDSFDQHITRTDGAWHWMLSRPFFRKAARGAC